MGPDGDSAIKAHDELEARAMSAIIAAKEKQAAEEAAAANKRSKKSVAGGFGVVGAAGGRGGRRAGMSAGPGAGGIVAAGGIGYGIDDGYDEEEDETDPDDQVTYALRRAALNKALESGNTAEVSRALRQFEHMLNTNEKVEKEEELLRRARDHLDYLRTRDGASMFGSTIVSLRRVIIFTKHDVELV